MTQPVHSRFRFASAPDSWGVLDYPGPSWEQSREKMLDEMAAAGYAGTELGPYGFFSTVPEILSGELARRGLALLGSFVPVRLGDAGSSATVIAHVRKVGGLLAALKAPFLVLADDQNLLRDAISGRVPADGSAGFTAEEWKNVRAVVAESAKIAADYGLDMVFHPHVATYVETEAETERFFDVCAGTGVGLCLDTGHCFYAGDDPIHVAEKFREVLRFVHIKDVDAKVLAAANVAKLTFDQGIEKKIFTIIGQGDIDFAGFFRVLAANDYRGWCVVEQDVKFGDPDVRPAESVTASLAYLSRTVASIS